MPARRPRTTPRPAIPRNADDVPVTAGMLFGVRRELIERVDAVDARLSGELQALRGDVEVLKADVRELKSDVRELKNDVATLKNDVATLKNDVATLKSEVRSDVHTIAAEVARIGVLVEEQNRRNTVVLDALQAFVGRTERLELRVDRLEAAPR